MSAKPLIEVPPGLSRDREILFRYGISEQGRSTRFSMRHHMAPSEVGDLIRTGMLCRNADYTTRLTLRGLTEVRAELHEALGDDVTFECTLK